MAKVSLTLDDVVMALKKGKRQIAEDTTTLNIPASVSTTGKRRFFRLDVSDEGKELLKVAIESRDKTMEDAKAKYDEGLEKLKEERAKNESGAWSELNKIADKVEEMRPRRSKSEETNSEEDDNASDTMDSDTSTPDDASQNYSAPPADSGYGQSSDQGYAQSSPQPSWGNN